MFPYFTLWIVECNVFVFYREADLEDFINHLFHQAMSTEQNGNAQWQPPSSQSPPTSEGWPGATNAAKKARRRKKKH
jgi:hypothetical protein